MYDIDPTFGPSAFDYTRMISADNSCSSKLKWIYPQRLTWPYSDYDYDFDYNYFRNCFDNF